MPMPPTGFKRLRVKVQASAADARQTSGGSRQRHAQGKEKLIGVQRACARPQDRVGTCGSKASASADARYMGETAASAEDKRPTHPLARPGWGAPAAARGPRALMPGTWATAAHEALPADPTPDPDTRMMLAPAAARGPRALMPGTWARAARAAPPADPNPNPDTRMMPAPAAAKGPRALTPGTWARAARAAPPEDPDPNPDTRMMPAPAAARGPRAPTPGTWARAARVAPPGRYPSAAPGTSARARAACRRAAAHPPRAAPPRTPALNPRVNPGYYIHSPLALRSATTHTCAHLRVLLPQHKLPSPLHDKGHKTAQPGRSRLAAPSVTHLTRSHPAQAGPPCMSPRHLLCANHTAGERALGWLEGLDRVSGVLTAASHLHDLQVLERVRIRYARV